jgi:hypothetical protein
MEEPTLESLILSGAIEVAAFDPENEELLYKFTEEANKIFPRLYAIHMATVHQEVMYFWEQGYLDIQGIDEPNPIISLNKKAFIDEELDKLPIDKQKALEDIKHILKVV